MRTSRFSFVAVAAILLALASNALAQQTCRDFRAVYHQTFMLNLATNVGGWSADADPVRALLDGQPLTPTVEYKPGNLAYPSAVAGRYWDYQQLWDLGNNNAFTVIDYRASFPLPAGKGGMGTYNGTGRISGGSGLFEGATGTLSETGPYLIWIESDAFGNTWMMGKYNALVIARICTAR